MTMKNKINTLIAALLSFAALFALAGCGDSEVGDDLEDAADEVMDAGEEVGEEVKEAGEELADEVKDATN